MNVETVLSSPRFEKLSQHIYDLLVLVLGLLSRSCFFGFKQTWWECTSGIRTKYTFTFNVHLRLKARALISLMRLRWRS